MTSEVLFHERSSNIISILEQHITTEDEGEDEEPFEDISRSGNGSITEDAMHSEEGEENDSGYESPLIEKRAEYNSEGLNCSCLLWSHNTDDFDDHTVEPDSTFWREPLYVGAPVAFIEFTVLFLWFVTSCNLLQVILLHIHIIDMLDIEQDPYANPIYNCHIANFKSRLEFVVSF